MNNDILLKVFFTITAAAVVVMTVLVAVVVIYIISIVRSLRRAVRTAEIAAEIVTEDVKALREDLKTRGFSLGVLASFLRNLNRRRVSHKRK